MVHRTILVTCAVVFGIYGAAALPASQNTQSTSTTQTTATGEQRTATGEKSVTGCVAREGDAFVLKTDDGTYEFNTTRDLSRFVGKKVRISGRWKATGVTTTAPVKSAGGTAEEAPPEKKAAPGNAFVGDLHLHIIGTVLGDCAPAQ
jgi:hypothetical protein